MKLSIYQIDAFAEDVFKGNPAAVCLLEEWLPDEVLQNIALENNLSETVFLVNRGETYEIRWFTPVVEVDLCGHATLASAYVIYEICGHKDNEIVFTSRSGELTVRRKELMLELDFPVSDIFQCEISDDMKLGLGKEPLEVWRSDDYIAVFESESDILSLAPDFSTLAKLECRGISVTAPGEKTDFVSRFFAPKCGVNEDPVTGSAHCELMPYWVARLGRNELSAAQLSKRGGMLQCTLSGKRVLISGKAVKYLEGTIEI